MRETIEPTLISVKFQYSWNSRYVLFRRMFRGGAIIATRDIHRHFRVNRFSCETVGSFLFETNSGRFSFLTYASLAPSPLLRLIRLIKTAKFQGNSTSTVVMDTFCDQVLKAVVQGVQYSLLVYAKISVSS